MRAGCKNSFHPRRASRPSGTCGPRRRAARATRATATSTPPRTPPLTPTRTTPPFQGRHQQLSNISRNKNDTTVTSTNDNGGSISNTSIRSHSLENAVACLTSGHVSEAVAANSALNDDGYIWRARDDRSQSGITTWNLSNKKIVTCYRRVVARRSVGRLCS